MKTANSFRMLDLISVLALLCFSLEAQASENAKSKAGPTAFPRSIFLDKHDSGRDPFFPHSARRRESLVTVVPTNNVPQLSAILGKLLLKGISGTRAQPLALINNSTIAEGELGEVRCDQRLVKVRCLEIRERSVLVELYGTRETRELKLRDGI